MKLSEVAEWARDILIAGAIPAKVELDPLLCCLPELGVYIGPSTVMYILQGNRARNKQQCTQRVHAVNLIVSKQFLDLPQEGTEGIANWDEVVPLIDKREEAEQLLIDAAHNSFTLSDVQPQPLEEIQMDYRNFIAMTTFFYEEIT